MKNNLERKVIHPQPSDMGCGDGVYTWNGNLTLKEALEWLKENTYDWGVITIKDKQDEIYRRFDYNTHREKEFYYKLDGYWIGEALVASISFTYCFCKMDIMINLE